ncbi:hypothetical protein GGI23_003143 [Coemansia sp. RSA 2559]|nr:hypothetical protein GGI23_003143 [Coemansia sp. RSA 2559]
MQHSRSGPQLPKELVLAIARYLWYGCASWSAGKQRLVPLGITNCRRFKVLSSRSREILRVCRAWRQATFAEHSRYTFGDCYFDAAAHPLPYLLPGTTKEVWLRYDGALLFGSWAIKWTQGVLHTSGSQRGEKIGIDTLVVIIVESPNTTTTDVEDSRAKCLADACLQALEPRTIQFFSQPCSHSEFKCRALGVGDRFARFYSHLSRLPVETPLLTSIETSKIGCNNSMIRLISATANSLEYLRIGCLGLSELQLLVSGARNGGLVFGRLAQLLITLDLRDLHLKMYDIKTTHFPNLDLLHVDLLESDISPSHETSMSIFEYSYLIDIFLHSPLSVRSLRLPLAWDAVELLTPTMLSHVRRLKLNEISMEGEHILDVDEANQILSNALELSNIRSISLNCTALDTELPLFLRCSLLHTLDIPFYALRIDQIVHLLKHLPLLAIFVCQLAEDYCPTTSPSTGEQSIDEETQRRLGASYDSPINTSIWSLSVHVYPKMSQQLTRLLFALIAALPTIRRAILPKDLCPPLREYLVNSRNSSNHRWSAKLLDNVNICPLASTMTAPTAL